MRRFCCKASDQRATFFLASLALALLGACKAPPETSPAPVLTDGSAAATSKVTTLESGMPPNVLSPKDYRAYVGNWMAEDGPACTFTLSLAETPFGWAIIEASCTHPELGKARYWRTSERGIDLIAQDGSIVLSYAFQEEDRLNPVSGTAISPLLSRAPVY